MAAPPDPMADPSDLEKTRQLPPGSRIASSWPRPAQKGPGAPASTVPRPAAGGDLFTGLPRRSSQPPAPSKGLQATPSRPPPHAPVEPPAPAAGIPVEEISSSMLMPDDSGALTAEAEELSGSVLVEEPADGLGPPVVTRLPRLDPPVAAPPPEAYAPPRLVEPAHRALLGMPLLPRSTPAPVLGARWPSARANVIIDESDPAAEQAGLPPASDEPVRTDAPAPRVIELPAEVAPEGVAEPHSYANPESYDEPVVPTQGFPVLVARAREVLERVRSALLAPAEERPGGRPQWTLAAVILAGLFVGIAVAGLLFSLIGKRKGPDEGLATAASAPPTASAPRTSATPTAAPAPTTVPQATVKACSLAATSQVIAPAALAAAGIDVRPFGDGVAVGFAPTEHEARGLRIDPASLATSGNVTARSADVVRHVRPVVTARDALGLVVDAERKHDRLQGRRTLPLDPPLQVGAFDGDLVWTRPGAGPSGKLWPLPGSDEIDALRAASEGAPGDTTTVIAFRRSNEVWTGVATGYRALAPKGDLSRIVGLGPSVGSPAVAVNEGAVLVAWSDRTSPDAPWSVRLVHMKAGEPASEPVTFAPPPGGPGGHVMSPGLAAVPGGRFLLVWTEGPTSQQRVRAVTLTASGETVGKALAISNEAVNSGQGQAAVTATGARGVVAFLQSADGGFQVAAAAFDCES